MRKIPLTQGKFALVDDADFEWLSQWKWCAIKWGNTWAATRNETGVTRRQHIVYMHRTILNLCRGSRWVTDHINHNGIDNRRCNLRVCTPQQNQWNYPKIKNTSSKYKGVSKHKDGGWVSNIVCNKKQIYLGYFKNERLAADSYDRKAIELFGEFANLNNKNGGTHEYQSN